MDHSPNSAVRTVHRPGEGAVRHPGRRYQERGHSEREQPERGHPAGGRPERGRQAERRGRGPGEPLQAAWDPVAERDRGERDRGERGRRPRRGVFGFFRNYGWRAYALPVLAALTALAVLQPERPVALPFSAAGGAPPATTAATTTVEPSAAQTTPLVPNPSDSPPFAQALAAAELPPGGPFTERGAGTFTVVPGTTPPIGTGELITYTVEVENGVELPGWAEGFARTVDATLSNPKSWIGSGKYAFQRVDTGTPKIRITLTSQQTTRTLCGFRIQFDASCWRAGRTLLNVARWERGAVAFQGNVIAYQQYVVNHEVGHGLGFGHQPCAEHGGLAPIMMQQTWGVANDYLAALRTDNVAADGKVCIPNPWPYPTLSG